MSSEPFFPLLDRLSEEQFAGGYWSFPEYFARVREEAAKVSEAEAAEVVAAWLAARGYPRDRLPSALMRAYAQGPRGRRPAERERMEREAEQRTNFVLGVGLLAFGHAAMAFGLGIWNAEKGGGARDVFSLSGLALAVVGLGLAIYGVRFLFRLAISDG